MYLKLILFWMPVLSILFDHLFMNLYNNIRGSPETVMDIVWIIMQI